MRKIISSFTLFAYLFCLGLPAETSDQRLKQTIQKAMDDRVVLEVSTELDKQVGVVVETKDEGFVLLNPMTNHPSQIAWGSVLKTKQLRKSSLESRARIASYLGKDRVITVELFDGSRVKGKVLATGQDSFTLQAPKTGIESQVEYDHVKLFDSEPAGQRTVRYVMIGVGAGLASLLVLFAAMMRD